MEDFTSLRWHSGTQKRIEREKQRDQIDNEARLFWKSILSKQNIKALLTSLSCDSSRAPTERSAIFAFGVYIPLKSWWSHGKHSQIPGWTCRRIQLARLDIDSSMFDEFRSTGKKKLWMLVCKVLLKTLLNLSFSHLLTSCSSRESKTLLKLLSSRHLECCLKCLSG